jgi:hypothetical protein
MSSEQLTMSEIRRHNMSATRIAAVDDHSLSVGRSALRDLGGIHVKIHNLGNTADTQTVTTDDEGKFTVDKMIPGDTYQVDVEGQKIRFQPMGNGDDIGTITLTDGVNFKTSITPTHKYADGTYSTIICRNR